MIILQIREQRKTEKLDFYSLSNVTLGLDFGVLLIHSDFEKNQSNNGFVFIVKYFILSELFLHLTSLGSIQSNVFLIINMLMLFNSVAKSSKVAVQSLYCIAQEIFEEKKAFMWSSVPLCR